MENSYEYMSMVAPTKYYQGRDVLERLYELTGYLGNNYCIVTDNTVLDLVAEKIYKAFYGSDAKYHFIIHEGEATYTQAEKIAEYMERNGCSVAVGAGGGKVVDSVKLAAEISGSVRTVIVPTSASSDAPCSANSVIYNANGTYLRAQKIKENPAAVIVDTEIILHAPVRLLVAGMGDAFVTYYEARASRQAGKPNFTGGRGTEAAYGIARLSRDLLLENGAAAKEAVEKGIWSEALEKAVEANIYLSGVGFENNGVAMCHGTNNGLNYAVPELRIMHGEGVAFGLLIQLALEYNENDRWDREEWKLVTDFYRSV
jgi:glycerol dehydrogenase